MTVEYLIKDTRALHVYATTCMVQPTIIRNGIAWLYFNAALQVQQILAQWHTCQPHTIPLCHFSGL